MKSRKPLFKGLSQKCNKYWLFIFIHFKNPRPVGEAGLIIYK